MKAYMEIEIERRWKREASRKRGKKQRKREAILGHGERNRGRTIGHKKLKSFKTRNKSLKDIASVWIQLIFAEIEN